MVEKQEPIVPMDLGKIVSAIDNAVAVTLRVQFAFPEKMCTELSGIAAGCIRQVLIEVDRKTRRDLKERVGVLLEELDSEPNHES